MVDCERLNQWRLCLSSFAVRYKFYSQCHTSCDEEVVIGGYMKLVLGLAGILLPTSMLPAQPFHRLARHNVPSKRLAVQVTCEDSFFHAARAKEITGGPELQMFLRVVSAFGRREVPHFYFAAEGDNAVYIAGSLSVDGKGKILISRTFVALLGNTPALEGILAHEVAHLVSDDGATGCNQWILRDPKQEKAADALAAKTVGYGPLRAFFLRIKELRDGRSAEMDDRLSAINALEEKEQVER
jgi:Zn-dependent protease with chaperone function